VFYLPIASPHSMVLVLMISRLSSFLIDGTAVSLYRCYMEQSATSQGLRTTLLTALANECATKPGNETKILLCMLLLIAFLAGKCSGFLQRFTKLLLGACLAYLYLGAYFHERMLRFAGKER
jgi:hypothetical protein